MLDAELGQGIHDSIGDHRKPRRDATLAPASQHKRVGRRWHFADLGLEKRQAVGPRQAKAPLFG